MQEYTLGFCFSSEREFVALIKKARPEWQAGKFNGIGGKVLENEFSLDCQIRKFEEETGVVTERTDWTLFATFGNDDFRVYCYRCFDNDIINKIDYIKTDEHIYKFPTDKLKLIEPTFVDHVNYLLALCLHKEIQFIQAKIYCDESKG